MEDRIYLPNRDKNFEMVGVDVWNGSATEVGAFQFVTKVTFPLLLLGGTDDLPWGHGTDAIIIVDPDGVVRWITGSGVEAADEISTIIDLINDPAPLSELSPKSLYFGRNGQVGSQSRITVKVENKGLRDLEVTDVITSSDDVTVSQTTFTVAPGETETFTVTLDPTQPGTFSGSVQVVTNEKNWSLEIPSIEIEGSLPATIVLPVTSVDYGSVEVGRSHVGTIEVRNDGPGPLNVSDLQSDLSGVTFSDTDFTVPAGESKSITVTIQPGSEGVFAGVVTVLSDDPDRPAMEVGVTGSGLVIPANARTDFDGSGTVDFGDFLGFAGAFGSSDPNYDVDEDGTVGFTDFLVFVENFGRANSRLFRIR